MKIHNPETLRKFMEKHSLTVRQVAETLGYTYREDSRNCETVRRMLNGDYNWEQKGLWVSEKLNGIR